MKKCRKKEKKISARKNTIVLTVSLFLLLVINNFVGGLNEYVSSCIMNYLDNKTFTFTYIVDESEELDEEVQSFIVEQEEVVACFHYGMDYISLENICLEGQEDDENKRVYVESYSARVMKDYIKGREIEELNDDEIIVGRYASFSLNWIADLNGDEELMDMEAYVGKTMTCLLKERTFDGQVNVLKKYTFRIVGVYDNIRAGKPNIFYVSDNVRQEMLELEDYHTSAIDEYGNEEKFYMTYYQVITDNSSSNTELVKKLHQKFPEMISTFHPVDYPDILVSILTGVILVGDFIIFYILINSISNVIYVTEDNLRKRRREFGILKAIGYRDKDLRNILLKESLLSSAKAMGISAAGGLVLFGVFRWLVLHKLNIFFSSMSFSTKPHTFILYFVVGLGVPLIGFGYGYRRLKNISAVEALGSE